MRNLIKKVLREAKEKQPNRLPISLKNKDIIPYTNPKIGDMIAYYDGLSKEYYRGTVTGLNKEYVSMRGMKRGIEVDFGTGVFSQNPLVVSQDKLFIIRKK
jgi:hypothetical protein